MRDERQPLAEQRHGRGRPASRSTCACRASAPTRTPSADGSTVARHRQPVDVDEVRRGGEAHVQQREQALAAGEHLGVAPELGEDVERLVDASRASGA